MVSHVRHYICFTAIKTKIGTLCVLFLEPSLLTSLDLPLLGGGGVGDLLGAQGTQGSLEPPPPVTPPLGTGNSVGGRGGLCGV